MLTERLTAGLPVGGGGLLEPPPQPTNIPKPAIIKNTRINGERNIQFRFEALNAFNHPLLSSSAYGNIQTSPTSATFGTIVGANQAGYPRRLQITFKYIF